MTTIPERLVSLAEDQPDREALRLLHPGEADTVLSRSELLGCAESAAVELAAAGVEAGDLVVIVQRDLLALTSTFFGAMLLGAVPSILPFATEKLHPERYGESMAALLALSQPKVLAIEEAVREGVESLLPAENLPTLLSIEASALASGPQVKNYAPTADTVALLQHSSGTTGLQKGVALAHETIFGQIDAYSRALGFTADDVVVSWLPLYHDMGLIAGFLMPLLSGARLVLMSPFDWVRAPYMLLQAISAHGGTFCWLPNFAYNFCAQKIRDRDLEGVDLSAMRAFVNCSEPVYAESHRMFAERFADYGVTPGKLTACYAMAEAVFAVSQSEVGALAQVQTLDRSRLRADGVAEITEPGPHAEEIVSSGAPLAGVEVRILDDAYQPLPEGHVGDIAIRGPFMFSGYHLRPQATAEAFHDGWYLTGDRGYLSGGEVYVLGRKKDLIIVGGRNVYPNDLEQLVNAVEGVYPGRATAFGVPNPRSGTEDVVVVAETTISDEDERKRIASAVRRSVAAGSDVTVRDVRLVERGWLVKTSSGKISRPACREKYLAEFI